MKKLILILAVFLVGSIIYSSVSVNVKADPPFTTNVRVDDTGTGASKQYQPSIAVDGDGNVYMAWWDTRNGVSDVYFAKSTNGGASFDSNVKVNDDIGTTWQGSPALAVDGGGNIYVVWEDRRNGDGDVYFAKSTNGGESFGTNIQVNDYTGNLWGAFPSIATDNMGNIYVVWQDTYLSSYPDIFFAKSTDGGESFGTNIRVNDDATNTAYHSGASVVAGAYGEAYVVWGDKRNGNYDVYFAKSSSGGYFETNIKVNDNTDNSDQHAPSIAIDDGGNLYVVWMDNRTGNYNINFAKSTDSGQSFGTNVKVNDDTGSTTQGAPEIVIDKKRTAHITWHDERNGNWDIYYSNLTEGGWWFRTNVRVNDDVGATLQKSPSVAVDDSENVYIAWEDTRNGDEDIYFAKRTVQTNPPPVAVTLQSPSSITSTSVQLSWSQNTDTDFSKYEVHKSTTSGFTPSSATLYTTITSQTTTSTTISGLIEETTYYFKVRVIDTGGLYTDSNEVSGTTVGISVVNHAPVVNSITANPTTVTTGETVTITVDGTDEDTGDTLTYHYECTGGTISGTGSSVTWIASSTAGDYIITNYVNDGKVNSNSKSVTVTVTSPEGEEAGGEEKGFIPGFEAPIFIVVIGLLAVSLRKLKGGCGYEK